MNLSNDHNVYILGAGFSREAGLPLVSDFLNRMRDSYEWLVSEGRHEEAAAVEQVLSFRLKAASAAYWVNLDLENIEELFSLASASEGSLNETIQIAISATLDFTRQTTTLAPYAVAAEGKVDLLVGLKKILKANWLDANNPESKLQPGRYKMDVYHYHVACFLGLFLTGNPQGKNTFISFNYDTILEDALRELGLKFCYGFSSRAVDFDKGIKEEVPDDAIPVLKLHGSINWGRKKGRGRSLKVFGSYEALRSAGSVPMLVPPTWKKVFGRQLEGVWRRAVESLATATRVIIIGFSMPPTDMHFKYLLAAGLRENGSLRRILFINPNAEQLAVRARDLLRGSYIDSKVIDFQATRSEYYTRDVGGLNIIGRGIPNDCYIRV